MSTLVRFFEALNLFKGLGMCACNVRELQGVQEMFNVCKIVNAILGNNLQLSSYSSVYPQFPPLPRPSKHVEYVIE